MARRTAELGIRIALGATRGQLVAMALRQGMTPVIAGIAAGLLFSASMTRLLQSQLYGATGNDLRLTAAVAALLLVVALAAVAVPARRATKIDPLTALRLD